MAMPYGRWLDGGRQPTRRSSDMNDPTNPDTTTRRAVLKAGVAGAAAAGLTAAGLSTASPAQALPLTPACEDGDETPDNIEGPYFKRNSPLRTDLVTADVTGVLLELSGTVFDERCRPVAGALLDFWQADSTGAYDNT